MRTTTTRSKNLFLATLIAFATALAPAEAHAATLPDATFTINQGKHESGSILSGPRLFCLSTRVDRTVSFKVLFTSTCEYQTQNAANQGDWNKVMGITTLDIHKNSIRLGWRWLPAERKIELGFYGYAKGQRIMQPLTKVNLDEWATVELRMHRGGLSAVANGTRHEVSQSLGFSSFFPTPTWVLRTAYFGGDETAPHAMTLRVKEIRAS
jgi:hypothetical protein